MSIAEYFNQASNWSYDKYEAQKTSAMRWRMAFFFQSGLSIMLVVSVLCMLPLKTTVPMPVYINEETGFVRVDKPTPLFKPEHESMIKSDIVRYIRNREGYIGPELNHRIKQIRYASKDTVYHDYLKRFSNPKDNIQDRLGSDGKIIAKVNSVVFLDSESAAPIMNGAESNLAKVDFTTITTAGGIEDVSYWTATISFSYRGLSMSEEETWENWNGFTISSYRLDQRIL